jgi:anaphase-promoting complex subunit 11
MSSRKRPSESTVVTTLPLSSQDNNKQRSLQIRIRNIHGVARWSWNANDDRCSICQNEFEGTAPGVKYPGEDCPVVFGRCRHAFHLQCVSQWLGQPTSKNSCPICRADWEFGSATSVNEVNANSNNALATTETVAAVLPAETSTPVSFGGLPVPVSSGGGTSTEITASHLDPAPAV